MVSSSLYCWLVCRFRPICAADVLNQSSKSSAAADNDEYRRVISRYNIARATCSSSVQPQVPVTTSRRSSRTFLLPSPSSAFSAPPARHADTVPPTVCRNTDVDVPISETAQCHGTPDVEYRYRRRGTVREMAQSYDRATQNEVSARRLSYTFRPSLPTTTTTTTTTTSATTTTSTCISSYVSKPGQAMTDETKRDHYTTTSVFSLSGSRPQSTKINETKQQETKLRRLYCNTVASLHKSIDNFTKLHLPSNHKNSVQESASASSELELRRSASSQHITDTPASTDRGPGLRNNNNKKSSIATFPLSSRHHSVSIHTLSNLSTQNLRDLKPEMEKSRNDIVVSGAESTASKSNRKHSFSSWNVASPATQGLDSGGKTDISNNLTETDTKKVHGGTDSSTERKMTEIKVVLERNLMVEPVKTSPRCLTVRQSPSLSLASSGYCTSTSLSMAFVSPRPIRKIIHHLEPLSSSSSSRARPTSAAALEKFNDAHQLLVKTAGLPNTSDEQGLKSSSPCKSLIELVRESHLNVFPFSNFSPSPPGQFSSNSWVTSPERRNVDVTPPAWSGGGTQQRRLSGIWNDHSRYERHKSSGSVSSGLATNDKTEFLLSASPVSQLQFRETPTARATASVPSPISAAIPRFSPSAQPQRARIGVISAHVSGVAASQLATTATTTTSHHHHHHHQQQQQQQNMPQASTENISRTYSSHKEDSLQNQTLSLPSTRQLQVLTSLSSSSSSSAAAVRHSQLSSALVSSTHQALTDQQRSRGQVSSSQSSGSRKMEVCDESLLTNGFVTAALDSAIELLTLKQPTTDTAITPGHGNRTSPNETLVNNDDLAEVEMTEFGYDLLDEEPIPVLRDKPRSKGHKTSEQLEHTIQPLPSKKYGCRTVKEELEAIQRRRVFQLQRKDDSFDKPTPTNDCLETTSPPGEFRCTTTTTTTASTVLPLPRDSVIARHRRRRASRHVITSSSSHDTMTSSSSSSRDTTPDKSPETKQSPPVIDRRTLRRRKRLRDPA